MNRVALPTRGAIRGRRLAAALSSIDRAEQATVGAVRTWLRVRQQLATTREAIWDAIGAPRPRRRR